MTTRKYLSNRKTSTQNISLSPALKEWIERYVRVMHKDNPEDDRFKSISAFYCYCMESLLNIFEKGKSIDDFDRLMDHETVDFYDRFTSNMLIPYIEPAVAMDKYYMLEFRAITRYFITFLKLWKQNVDPYDPETSNIMFERLKRRYLSSNLTKDMSIEINKKKGSKHYTGYIEHIGTYKNLHHLNCKMMCEVLGILGIKITDFFYSEKDMYYRIDCETTELFFSDEDDIKERKDKKERIDILRYNVEFLINFQRIVNDKDYYLWSKMAEDNDVIINFNNQKARDKWFKNIEKDAQKYGMRENFHLTFLKFFDRMHWIRIINEQDLEFQFEITDEDFHAEKEFVLNTLSKHCREIVEEKGIYYLER